MSFRACMTQLEPIKVPPANLPERAMIQQLGDMSVFYCGKVLGREEEEQLRRAIFNQIGEGTIVLDLAELEAVDPEGMGVLVTAASYAVRVGTRLKLMNVRPAVGSFLADTHLLATFDLCTPEESVALWCRAVCRDARRGQ